MITIEEVKAKTPERFWSKIKFGELNECWEWQACRRHAGHGEWGIVISPKVYAKVVCSRFVYESLFGKIGDTKLKVCHNCDNPPCCNPNHFFLGTQRQNLEDMDKKGRRRWGISLGSKHGMAKLTEEKVCEIKKLITQGYSNVKLSGMYGVADGQISKIRHGHQWKHVIV